MRQTVAASSFTPAPIYTTARDAIAAAALSFLDSPRHGVPLTMTGCQHPGVSGDRRRNSIGRAARDGSG